MRGRINAGRLSSRTATSHVGHPGRSSFNTAIHGQGAHALNHGLNHVANPAAARAGLAGAHLAHANAFAGRASFAANRHFAGAGAFHPFWNHGWHWHNHLGWVGPLFWPFAYGDFFYYALWPGDYYDVDPFWVYGYGDIYEGIFSPYVYDDYVHGPDAPARMTALTQSMAQSCGDEATEVTGWPINQISDAVQPNPQQSALLDDLGNAVVKAGDVIRSHCPTNVSFTPTGRLDTMQQRLQGLVQAVNIVSEPLSKFYDSLSDEQKARFNSIKPATDKGCCGKRTGCQCDDAEIRLRCLGDGMADRADRSGGAAERCAARQARRLEVGRRERRRHHQGGLSERDAEHAAGAPRRGRQAPASHVAGGRRHPAAAARLLQFAERQSEGALQHHGQAAVRAEAAECEVA